MAQEVSTVAKAANAKNPKLQEGQTIETLWHHFSKATFRLQANVILNLIFCNTTAVWMAKSHLWPLGTGNSAYLECYFRSVCLCGHVWCQDLFCACPFRVAFSSYSKLIGAHKKSDFTQKIWIVHWDLLSECSLSWRWMMYRSSLNLKLCHTLTNPLPHKVIAARCFSKKKNNLLAIYILFPTAKAGIHSFGNAIADTTLCRLKALQRYVHVISKWRHISDSGQENACEMEFMTHYIKPSKHFTDNWVSKRKRGVKNNQASGRFKKNIHTL